MEIAYKGRRVPWITKWTEEEIPEQPYRVARSPQPVLMFDGPTLGQRDSRGVLWFRDGGGRGGEPIWSEVHATRQRRALTRPVCQVCGETVPATGTPWLFAQVEWETFPEYEAEGQAPRTMTAPTCEGCWDEAERLCPHLRGSRPLLRCHVGRIVPWGIFGNRYCAGAGGTPRAPYPFTDQAAIDMTVAKQLIVELHDITPVG